MKMKKPQTLEASAVYWRREGDLNPYEAVIGGNTRVYKGAVDPLKLQRKSAVLLAVTAPQLFAHFHNFCPYSATSNAIIN